MNTTSNKIVTENKLEGTSPSVWSIPSVSSKIEGYATAISVNHGETVYFKVNADAEHYDIDIYRMGYYLHGEGARKVTSISPCAPLPQIQPSEPCVDATTGLVDYGNWKVSASWDVPKDQVSGVYIARLERKDIMEANYIFFIVRDDEGHSEILMQVSDTTWHAYNSYGDKWGGGSLYTHPMIITKVSYNRPFANIFQNNQDVFFYTEQPMIRWLERNGYDVSYFTGVDSDLRGSQIKDHKVFLSVGHDEYWSKGQRDNVEAARNAGVHLAFLSGNEILWKTRWENSIDGSVPPQTYRTLVCYKETLVETESQPPARIDPTPEWTGTWRDPLFSPPSDGGRPENALTGTIYTVMLANQAPGIIDPEVSTLRISPPYSQRRLWRNTRVAALAPGEIATFPDILGTEWDEDLDNGFRPAGLVHYSSSYFPNTSHVGDFGVTLGPGRATHHLTLYKHSSGALVFGAGTMQWAWGLDNNHDAGTNRRNSSSSALPLQQATVNLFADMGVQPANLQVKDGLTHADGSTDTTAPTSVITSPTNGSTVPIGKPTTITGTASDADGVVCNVEVSVDGGRMWHPATGDTNWSYRWRPNAFGPTTILSRAVDDSANLETSSPGITVTVGANSGPFSFWDDTVVPRIEANTRVDPLQVGVQFCSDVDGDILGIRFYKSACNTGPHIGYLWEKASRKMLRSVDFKDAGDKSTGWKEARFATPIPIKASTPTNVVTYIASYWAPNANYAIDYWYFHPLLEPSPELVAYPLRTVSDDPGGLNENGVYSSAIDQMPINSHRKSENFWIDVIFMARES
jgi:Mo-co oxidoreductase dimerisation domain.